MRGKPISRGNRSGLNHFNVETAMPRQPKSRKWCFTLHKWHANHVLRLRHPESYSGQYVIFGREVSPSTGSRHLQGFLYFKSPITRDGVKKRLGDGFNHIHLEMAKGTVDENYRYCSKDGDFEQYGDKPSQGLRSDLLKIRDQIKIGVPEQEIASTYFTRWVIYRRSFEAYRKLVHEPRLRLELEVFLIVGAPGTGKTRFIWENHSASKGGLWMSHDPTLQWFDGYDGQRTVVLDDFRGGADFAFLLRLLDIYPVQVPIKGGFKSWIPERIYITSNVEADGWYPNVDIAPLLRRIKKTARISAASNPSWDSVSRFLSKTLGFDEK